jgi:hypothetical protein
MTMHGRPFLSSVTRLCEISAEELAHEAFSRQQWSNADLVVGEVLSQPGALSKVELSTGRMIDIMRGDRVVGALGRRAATLECVGDYESIGDDLVMDLMTPGGLLGKITSQSSYLGALPSLRYLGHVTVQGEKASLSNFVGRLPAHPLKIPVVLIVGTSMSAGKTATARLIIRLLKEAGWKVAAAKLTGAARYRDILSMHDAGADHIMDFVDVGLPSSICPQEEYSAALEQMIARVGTLNVDILVAEAGASPLEPYNGATAIRLLGDQVRLTALAASDPYAVVGVMKAFDLKPDLVTGVATNTTAGIALIEKISDSLALNILDESCWNELNQLLKAKLFGPDN